MCPHLNNNFTPVADNLPPAVMRSAESAAGGSDLPVSVLTESTTTANQSNPAGTKASIGDGQPNRNGCNGARGTQARESTVVPSGSTLAAGNSFEASGGVEIASGTGALSRRHARGPKTATPSVALVASRQPAGVTTGPLASFPIPHICISCGQTLRAKQDASRVVVYCGYGPCKSKAANEGAFGRTVGEAVDELNARICAEPLEV